MAQALETPKKALGGERPTFSPGWEPSITPDTLPDRRSRLTERLDR